MLHGNFAYQCLNISTNFCSKQVLFRASPIYILNNISNFVICIIFIIYSFRNFHTHCLCSQCLKMCYIVQQFTGRSSVTLLCVLSMSFVTSTFPSNSKTLMVDGVKLFQRKAQYTVVLWLKTQFCTVRADHL